MFNLIWTDESLQDLKIVELRLEALSHQLAMRTMETLKRKTKILTVFPEAGRIVGGVRRYRNKRELIYKKYLIQYEIVDGTVYITRVVNSSQNLLAI